MTTRRRSTVGFIRIAVLAFSAGQIGGCSLLNTLEGQNDFCRSMLAEIPERLSEHVTRELRKESPNGALTKPYSRHIWNQYWNDRVFHVQKIGPQSCGGTYAGPPGEEIIENALTARREAGLPELVRKDRNKLQETPGGTKPDGRELPEK